MPKIDELLHEHSLHSVRSDGSQMVVLETERHESGPEWEILLVGKDGSVKNDGTLILHSGEKTVVRKICTSQQLLTIAASHDFVEWRTHVIEEHPDEHVLLLQDQLARTERSLEQMTTQYETANERVQQAAKQTQELQILTASQRKKERMTPRVDLEEIEQRFKTTAAAIAERTPSETQKIIANQVELGAGFYQEVGVQSHESFRLSLWLAAAGGVIFFLTVVAAVLVTFLRGESILITVVGSLAAAITEALAASNRLYNQATTQFTAFQVDLDRINRSSICYAMVSEEAFEKKTEKQQEAIITIVTSLLQSS